jgi:hypothetical protein
MIVQKIRETLIEINQLITVCDSCLNMDLRVSKDAEFCVDFKNITYIRKILRLLIPIKPNTL